MSGIRNNQGKLRWSLFDYKSLEQILEVLEKGAIIHEEGNWQLGLHREETLESMQRHLSALMKGEEIDPDPNFKTHHAANLAVNCMFYLYHHRNKSFSKKRNSPFKKVTKTKQL